jgi:WD40 repeat protein
MKWASLFSFLLRSKAREKHVTSSAIPRRSCETYTPKPQHVFISYARADDEEFVLKLYEDLTRNGVNVWWDRRAMESRGRTFLQEIRDAIEGSDRVLAVIGPMALKSEYVRSEWEHALLFCNGVLPLLRKGDFLSSKDPNPLAREIGQLHTVDFRLSRPYGKALLELLRLFREPVSQLGPFRTLVPSLPPHFLPRRADLDDLGRLALADVQRPVVITSAKQTTALQGMGGIGKSVLVGAFARSAQTRRAFNDGIVWLKAGLGTDPLSCIRQAGLAFGGAPEQYVSMETASVHLPGVLADKACLLILDDVWDVAQAAPLRNALGPRCRLLITTRDGGLVSALGAQEQRVGVLNKDAALGLLATWSECQLGQLPAATSDVANECGYLPLALAMCGALARDGVPWADIREALQQADLTYIQRQFADYPYPDVLKALQVSIEELKRSDARAAECFAELAVFPPVTVPEAAVLRLWMHGRSLRNYQASKLLVTLERKALLRLSGEEPTRRVSLHDLQYDYLHGMQLEQLKSLHERLLAAYATQCSNGWPTGPRDGYYFEYLAWHLKEAKRTAELKELLLNFRWLQTKLAATDASALLADYDYLSEETDLRPVQSVLRQSAHILAGNPRELPGQLLGSIVGGLSQDVDGLLKEASKHKGFPWLRPLSPSLNPVNASLVRTLQGHTDMVFALAVAPDGRYVVSGSDDRTLRVWDLATGETTRTLQGHTGCVRDLAVTPDGRYVVSGSDDRTLRVWDLATGETTRTLQGHTDLVFAVAVTPDGRYVISGSYGRDLTLRVWDLTTGETTKTLQGHADSVQTLTVTPDGRYVVSGSSDNTLRVWDLATGETTRTLQGHADSVHAVAVTPDGRYVVSGSHDRALRVWDLATGETTRTLQGHTASVRALAVTPDGRYVVSGSHDRTLRVWDLATGETTKTLEGHASEIFALAVTPDGRYVVSGSSDNTLRVWDLATGETRRTLQGHAASVFALAVTPDGRYVVSGSHDCHAASAPAMVVTPDGNYVLSCYGGTRDRTLRVWDLATGETTKTLQGHTAELYALAVTPDGRYVVSGSNDHTLRVWDIKDGRELVTFTVDGRVMTCVAAQDSRTIVAGDSFGRVHFLRLEGVD